MEALVVIPLIIFNVVQGGKGRPKGYLDDDGQPVGPPPSGWLPCRANTDHGAILKAEIRAGRIKLKESPQSIWERYPKLRVVNPHNGNFGKFVRSCKAALAKEPMPASVGSTSTSSSSYDNDQSDVEQSHDDQSNDDSSSSGSESDLEHQPERMKSTRVRATPLLSFEQMNKRDIDHLSPTKVVHSDDMEHVWMIQHLLNGQDAQQLVACRQDVAKRFVDLSEPAMLQNETCSSDIFPGLHEETEVMRSFAKAMVTHRGTSIHNDLGMPSLYNQCVDMGMEVQASPSPWIALGTDGREVEMPAAYNIGPYGVWHFKALDSKKGEVSRLSPLRPPPRVPVPGFAPYGGGGGGGGGAG